MVTVFINGEEVQVEVGDLVIEAAEKAGVYIPRFCWHERMKPVAMCRMCLVEVDGIRGNPPSCATPVSDGMKVTTNSESVKKLQEGILEFLLINHPLDCPVCDRGGECPLQDQTVEFGPGESRFKEEKRHWVKPIPLSDLVLLDRERCIQCARCTRFAEEIVGDPLITFAERGDRTEVATFPDSEFSSYFSGNTVQICPVGALTSNTYRFKARPWDLSQVETTCTGCSVGCRGILQASENEATRLLGVDLDEVNQGWLCDRGRYGATFEKSSTRFLDSVVKNSNGTHEKVSTFEALEEVSNALKNSKVNVGALGGANLLNEDQVSVINLFKNLGNDNITNIFSIAPNVISNELLGHKKAKINDLDSAQNIVILGEDIKESHPVLFLRVKKAVEQGAKLTNISFTPLATKDLATQYSGANIEVFPGEEARLELPKFEGKTVVIAANGSNLVWSVGYEALVTEILNSSEETLLMPTISNYAPDASFNAVGALLNGLDQTREIRENLDLLFIFDTEFINSSPQKHKLLKLIRSAKKVICFEAFITEELMESVDIFLPVKVWAEQSGTTTNIEGRVQPVTPKVEPNSNLMDISEILEYVSKLTWPKLAKEKISGATTLTLEDVLTVPQGILTPISDHVEENIEKLNNSPVSLSKINKLPKFALKPSWDPLPLEFNQTDVDLAALSNKLSHVQEAASSDSQKESIARSEVKQFPRDSYSLRVVLKTKCYQNTFKLNAAHKMQKMVPDTSVSDSLNISTTDANRLGVVSGQKMKVKTANSNLVVVVNVDDKLETGLATTYLSPTNEIIELAENEDNIFDLRIETLMETKGETK